MRDSAVQVESLTPGARPPFAQGFGACDTAIAVHDHDDHFLFFGDEFFEKSLNVGNIVGDGTAWEVVMVNIAAGGEHGLIDMITFLPEIVSQVGVDGRSYEGSLDDHDAG